jgi:hypothetical protein
MAARPFLSRHVVFSTGPHTAMAVVPESNQTSIPLRSIKDSMHALTFSSITHHRPGSGSDSHGSQR